MERVRRVELPTLCLASIRSSQLSYTRIRIQLHQETFVVNLVQAGEKNSDARPILLRLI
jgi:hypothetical protein